MTSESYRRKLTALLSMDVKGYSRLMEEDDALTVQTLTSYRDVISGLVEEWRGRVVDSPGDNILSEFHSVVDAVQCAVNIQKDLKIRNAQLPENRRMKFRIGINMGEVIEEKGRLYGDGVNIAARLEALAEEGGIWVSGIVNQQIKNKLKTETEYIGEHEVKNITDPIPVYRILLDEGDNDHIRRRKTPALIKSKGLLIAILVALFVLVTGFIIFKTALSPIITIWGGAETSSSSETLDKPSIAILPFDNMSGDPEQEYFSDGLTEDIITDLSKVSGLFVIARNSAFVYKDQAVNIQEVGRELGVDYVLEGSVRNADGLIRITAQLIDASTGGHVWAERYDREMNDIFSLQDDVVEEIVIALAVNLTQDEKALLQDNQTSNLEVYELTQRGWWYYHQFTREANDQARIMFEQAVILDEQYASAITGLGFTYYESWAQFWSQDLQGLDQAYNFATEAISLDETLSGAHTLLSHVYLWRNQHDLAITEQELALTLEPNNSFFLRDMAELLIFVGKPGQAIPLIERAMLLDPHYPVTFPFTLGFAHSQIGFSDNSPENYEQAIVSLKEALTLNPYYFPSHLLLAFVHGEMGRVEEACDHYMQAIEINPQLVSQAVVDRLPFQDPSTADRILNSIDNACPE